MTSDDLVRRLQAAKRCIYHPRSQAVEDEAERAIDDAIAALAAPPAAPPTDLVALVREWQEAMRAYPKTADVAGLVDAQAALLTYPLPAAPRVPDTPQDYWLCARGAGNCRHRECKPPQEPPRAPDTPQGWQPIETAPKDGTDVLLGWFDLPGMKMRRVGHWHPRENAWIDTHHVLHNQQSFPTHWATLLEPPAAPPQEPPR